MTLKSSKYNRNVAIKLSSKNSNETAKLGKWLESTRFQPANFQCAKKRFYEGKMKPNCPNRGRGLGEIVLQLQLVNRVKIGLQLQLHRAANSSPTPKLQL